MDTAEDTAQDMVSETAAPAPSAAGWPLEYLVAGGLSVLWAFALLTYGAGYFGVFEDLPNQRPAQFLEVIIYLCAVFMPLVFLWIGAMLLVRLKALKRHAFLLEETVDLLGKTVTLGLPSAMGPEMAQTIGDAVGGALKAEQSRNAMQFRNLAEQQGKVEAAVKTLLKVRGQDQQAIAQLVETAKDAARKTGETGGRPTKLSKMTFEAIHGQDNQDPLPLDAPETALSGEIEWAHVLRALNFPEDEGDRAGFDAIRSVLPNRLVAQLLQSSEDVLAMLAQEGIYMDDLRVDMANPDLWRHFQRGGRGEVIAEIGTIVDQAAIALARGRTRSDAVFRDATLQFLRLFDQFLQEFLGEATDQDIIDLADTRTGRAFQLLARVTGTFD